MSSSTSSSAWWTTAETDLECQSIISNATNWPQFIVNFTWGLNSKCQSTISDFTLGPQILSFFGMWICCTIGNDTLTNYFDLVIGNLPCKFILFRFISAQNGFSRPKTQTSLYILIEYIIKFKRHSVFTPIELFVRLQK